MQLISAIDRNYSTLYGKESSATDEDSDERKREGRETFGERWGWFTAIEAVAEVKKINFDEVTELKVMEFLNFLCYIKEKNNRQ